MIHSIVAPGPVEAPAPVEAQSPIEPEPPEPPTRSQTFNLTGAEQQFIVPAGVTSVTIEALGAEGGGGFPALALIGGRGGCSVATIAVTPGEALFVYVGGRGGDDDDSTNPDTPGVGGFNGGGGGGVGFIVGGSGGGYFGGGGGGSSFAIPTATNVTHQQGVQSGNGQVIISW
ncbi:MAG: hypothetical protein L6R45_05810 [Anaerolineae bacterium]|nr:hypothetical protein [Anaerolineae bacterium]